MTVLPEIAGERQLRAADPAASVWVAASAGTGKTKVLTDRVLSLLLAGTPPHKILCLTFTKAAAAEMANRIAGRLAGWATASDTELAADLGRLLGAPPGGDVLLGARRLFARVLDTPGGMHIETIHAFCQSLMRRFPLEAGVAPHFQVMDERDAGELMEAAKERVLAGARDGADAHLAAALAAVTSAIHESSFPELTAELARDRGRLKRLIDREGGLDGAVAALRRALGLGPGETAATILAAACAEGSFDAAGCRRAAEAMLGGKATDAKRGAAMAAWLADPDGRAAGFEAYSRAFLTAAGTVYEKLCTKELAHCADILAAEAERVLAVVERLKAVAVAEASAALVTLGHALLEAYERAKAARALMDYDDLILAARGLLERPGVAPWVLFKLDGGIDHVLIDEAQDTNPDQWAVVAALTAEFFAGRGAREWVRTVFAVGDSKQSIYSFQRADPRAFEEMRALFAAHVPAANGEWREVALSTSFRSTPAVLDAVDAVFLGPGADGVAGQGYERHVSARKGQAGLVELWPPVAPRALDDPAPWKPPVERIRGDSPRTRLARLVARRIARMIGTETLESKGRPVRAGDVMVLLRRRGGFVEDLVRALKELGVEVAGADRMVLAEQMAVADLVALGDFLLLPDDDLTLAAVLKSPLVGLTEEQLFALAWNRGKTGLWETLKRRMLDDPDFERAWLYLSDLLALADRLSPHALYARVLDTLGGRRALVARLGVDALDPLDEFIGLALAYERGRAPSLQGFLRWLETGSVEIKRDLEQGGRDAVRIMTVHGSKGLQAPIVFLPDTMQVPGKGDRLLWMETDEGEVLAWPPRAAMADPVCRAGREAQKLAREREYRRLLYVAMTRAEDRLYLCGWQTRKAPPEACWYALVRDALAPLASTEEDSFLAAEGETEGSTVLRLRNAQDEPVMEPAAAPPEAVTPEGLPEWASRPPPDEPVPPRPLAPSRLEGEEPAARSPLAGGEDGARFRRGQLIHRLLQTLPDLAPEARAAAATRFLSRAAHDLPAAERHAIAAEARAVLDHPRFARLFAPGSRAEVPVAGLVGEGRAISGVLDRLAVTDTEVLVADYKTNRRPSADAADIPILYLRQMAAYRMALACIYPGRAVRCALVWTDGPILMEIPSQALDDALAGMLPG